MAKATVMRRMSWGSSAWRATYSNSGRALPLVETTATTQTLLINQCNTIQDESGGSTSFKLTDLIQRLPSCLDKDSTTYYAQFGLYPAGCANSEIIRTGSIGTSELTHGEALNNDGVNVDGTCVKCSRAGLEMTSMTDPTTQARALGLRKPPLKKAYSPKSTSASQLP